MSYCVLKLDKFNNEDLNKFDYTTLLEKII